MKVRLIQIGKTDEPYLEEGVNTYVKRLKHYSAFETLTLPPSKNRTIELAKEEEGKLILSKITPGDVLFLLDEKGDEYTSVGFSQFLQKKMNAGVRTLVFVIGGPFGFSRELYDRANGKLALSKMTFSHQMIRLFFAEQLYRAFTILKGEKYHHE